MPPFNALMLPSNSILVRSLELGVVKQKRLQFLLILDAFSGRCVFLSFGGSKIMEHRRFVTFASINKTQQIIMFWRDRHVFAEMKRKKLLMASNAPCGVILVQF